jgi:hypothetical protein
MNTMTVTIRRTGGIAGISRRWSVTVDPEEPSWRELLGRLPWDERPAPQDGVDRYVYIVTCEPRTVEIPEHGLTGAWRDLLERVRAENDAGGDDKRAATRR